MAVKYFCDFCESEITDDNRAEGGPIHSSSRLGASMRARNGRVIKVEIITSMDGVTNDGIACRFCILDALGKLDTRPRCVEAR